jgi:hypothetical protein
MRITRKAKLAAGLVATLAIFTATLPSNAAPTDPVAVAAQPVAGSSNVEVEGNRIILGDAAAAIGSTEIKQRSGLAELTPVRFTTATSAVVVGYTTGTPDGSSAEVDVRAWSAVRRPTAT